MNKQVEKFNILNMYFLKSYNVHSRGDLQKCHLKFGPESQISANPSPNNFFAYKIRPEPHMNSQKRLRGLFRFREDIRSQSSKIACPRIR